VAYDEELADRIREQLGVEDGVSEKAMFGGLALLVGGHMAVAASGQGRRRIPHGGRAGRAVGSSSWDAA
jgi:hypothetical protein